MYLIKLFRIANFFIFLLMAVTIIQSEAQTRLQLPKAKPSSQQKTPQQKKPDSLQDVKAEEPVLDISDEIVKIDTGLVQLNVTVIDQSNLPVFNLSKENFAVYEDKIKQVIESVSREELPISFGFVIDTSGSMSSKLQTVTDAASDLLKRMRPNDEGFVAQFKYDTEIVQGYTLDKRKIEKTMEDLSVGGGTALLDAIIDSSNYAAKNSKQQRKALIIFSDGLEKHSSVKELETMEAVRENEAQIYLIGFIDDPDSNASTGRPADDKGRRLLEHLADESGGRAFFPKSLSEIPAIAQQIANDLRTQYIVRYYPSKEKRDGTYRAVQVTVDTKENRKLIARTRKGYYARNEKETTDK